MNPRGSKSTLYVHIGRSKTGTSAFQAVMRTNAHEGLLYPETGQWADGAHHKLIMAFNGVEKRGDQIIEPFDDQLASLQKEIAAAAGRDVLLSSEILFGPENGIPFVHMLQSSVGSRFDSIEIIAVYRNHLDIASSLYNQRVKDPVSAETRDPDAFLEEQAPSMRYRPSITRWQNSSLPFRLLSYHPRASYLDRMLSQFGIEAVEGDKMPTPNASLPPVKILATLAANRFFHDRSKLPALSEHIRKDASLREIPATGSFLFSQAAADRFETLLQDDRAFIEDRLQSNENLESRRPEPFRLSPDAAAMLLRYLDEIGIPSAERSRFRQTISRYVSQPS